MKKIILTALLFTVLMLGFYQGLVFAQSMEEYIDNAYVLIEQQRFDDALDLLKEAYDKDPGNMGLAFAFAAIYHSKKDYYAAIVNYLNIINAVEEHGKEAPVQIHHNLVDAYNELAQEHYFNEEVCLRIIYHVEKVFELTPEALEDERYVEFLRKTIGHYEIAKMGAKMLEEGGDGEDFDLPNDLVTDEKKMIYKEKAVTHLADLDYMRRESNYRTIDSSLVVYDIAEILNEKKSKINSIHFKVIITDASGEEATEEIYYKNPDKFKAVQKGVDSIVVGKKYYVIQKATNKIIDEKPFDLEQADMLKAIYLPNLQWISNYYDLKVEVFKQVPDFLRGFYSNGINPNLYLVTADLKQNTDSPYYPSVIRLEYYIDIKLGIAIAIREFWPGILGSGQKYELSKEHLVKSVKEIGPGSELFFPDEVEIKGKVKELSGLNQNWVIVFLSLNENIDDEEFSVESYIASE